MGVPVWRIAAELADLVLPRPCPGCGGPGPWCPGCATTLLGRPREPVLSETTLDAFAAALPGRPVPVLRALARYRGPVRAAIVAGKERGRRDLPPRLGDALGAGLWRLQQVSLVPASVCLVPAPTRAAAARSRGGDPVLAMARSAAGRLAPRGHPIAVAACLRTAASAADSARLSATERAVNLAGRVRVRHALLPPPELPIVLLDDVLTTGATVIAACAALATVGREVSTVLTVAAVPPWRDVR